MERDLVAGVPTTDGRARAAVRSLALGAISVAVSIVFPLGPVLGIVAIVLGLRARTAPTRSVRLQAWGGIALGVLSFLVIAGWAADGFS